MENLQPVERLAREVTRIMFGDDHTSEMSLRLTRIALEYHKVPEIISPSPSPNGRIGAAKADLDELFERVVHKVSCIFFDDKSHSEMHLRLTRIALERYNVPSIITSLPETNGRSSPPAYHAPGVALDS